MSTAEPPTVLEIPENFKSTMSDFIRDLTTTFPEYEENLSYTKTMLENNVQDLFMYCLQVYPERFFDILYQNDDLFGAESDTNTMFLPGLDFKQLYHCDGVSENTKKTIWKYLQILLFSLIGSVKDKSTFGDAMNMFEGIDEKDLQSKMQETMESIGEFFKAVGEEAEAAENAAENAEEEQPEEFKFDPTQGMPNLNDMHEHLKGLFDGKIGRLAKNIAEEISGDFEKILGEDYKDVRSTKDIFQKMMKNPQKMMELIKKVGDKIKSRMDSGEISKDDIMAEAGDILRKMKEMGGGSDDKLQEMLRNMAKNMGMGKNARVDMNAVNRMTKQQATRERLRSKIMAKRTNSANDVQQSPPDNNFVLEQTGQSNYVFKMPEEGEQPRSGKLPPTPAVPKYTDAELISSFETTPTQQKGGSQKSKSKKSKGKK